MVLLSVSLHLSINAGSHKADLLQKVTRSRLYEEGRMSKALFKSTVWSQSLQEGVKTMVEASSHGSPGRIGAG